MNLDSSALKEIARGALQKKWGKAILTTLVATLLGAFSSIEKFLITFSIVVVLFVQQFDGMALAAYMNLVAIAAVIGFLFFFLGGLVRFGHIEYSLALLDRRPAKTSMLFCKSDRYWNAVYMEIIMSVLEAVCICLLIVPGIIFHYTYAMTPYILAERADFSVMKAMKMSRKIMKGHKWQLFCLHFSFLLWKILGILTFGLVRLIYKPYEQTAEAALYNEISGRARIYYRRR